MFKTDPFRKGWPAKIPTISSNKEVTRNLDVFNDGLFGDKLAHKLGSAMGPRSPATWPHRESFLLLPLSQDFTRRPNSSSRLHQPTRTRTLFLILNSVKDGRVVFKDDQVRFLVSPIKVKGGL